MLTPQKDTGHLDNEDISPPEIRTHHSGTLVILNAPLLYLPAVMIWFFLALLDQLPHHLQPIAPKSPEESVLVVVKTGYQFHLQN